MDPLEQHRHLQIEQAASGSVSGTLREWPHLKHALAHDHGIILANTTDARTLRNICRLIVADELRAKVEGDKNV